MTLTLTLVLLVVFARKSLEKTKQTKHNKNNGKFGFLRPDDQISRGNHLSDLHRNEVC